MLHITDETFVQLDRFAAAAAVRVRWLKLYDVAIRYWPRRQLIRKARVRCQVSAVLAAWGLTSEGRRSSIAEGVASPSRMTNHLSLSEADPLRIVPSFDFPQDTKTSHKHQHKSSFPLFHWLRRQQYSARYPIHIPLLPESRKSK